MVSQLYKSTGMSDDEIRDMYEIVLAVCNNNWGKGSRFLFARVMPNSGDEGKAFWWPWTLVFVQDNQQYAITTDDLLALSETFSGRVYASMTGFIRVPDQIDYSRPFDILV